MDRQSRVVRLDNGIGDLGGWDDGEGRHHAVRELLTDLGDEESPHTSTSATAEGVGDLEALKAVAPLSLAADDIEDLINKFSTLSVVALGPIVASAGLAKDEVVRAEELTEGTSTDGIHGAWLKVDEDGARDELVAGRL